MTGCSHHVQSHINADARSTFNSLWDLPLSLLDDLEAPSSLFSLAGENALRDIGHVFDVGRSYQWELNPSLTRLKVGEGQPPGREPRLRAHRERGGHL